MKLEHIVAEKSKQLNSYTYGQKYSRLRWPFQKFNSLFKAELLYEGRLKVILLLQVQVNFCQKYLFSNQLTHNMKKDCSLI